MYALTSTKTRFFLLLPLLLLLNKPAKAQYSFWYDSSYNALLYTTIVGAVAALSYACKENKTPCSDDSKMNWHKMSISTDYGRDKTIEHRRIAIGSDWGEPLYESKNFVFKGRWELNFNRWFSTKQNAEVKAGTIWGLTPVNQFVYTRWRWFQPYLEVGAGPQYFSSSIIEDENKSTQFQFADHLGFGFLNERMEMSLRYIHFSNANIKTPNPGLDTFNLHFAYKFDL